MGTVAVWLELVESAETVAPASLMNLLGWVPSASSNPALSANEIEPAFSSVQPPMKNGSPVPLVASVAVPSLTRSAAACSDPAPSGPPNVNDPPAATRSPSPGPSRTPSRISDWTLSAHLGHERPPDHVDVAERVGSGGGLGGAGDLEGPRPGAGGTAGEVDRALEGDDYQPANWLNVPEHVLLVESPLVKNSVPAVAEIVPWLSKPISPMRFESSCCRRS